MKKQGTLCDSIHDFWFGGEPDAGALCTYAARGELTEYYEKYADSMDLTKKKFERIVENVREVDRNYQKEFAKSNEAFKEFQETLKTLTEEISLRTLSLNPSHYSQAVSVLEGEDSSQKEKLKLLIGVTPGTAEESRINQKIKEILKYSTGNGGLDDELDAESEESIISQKVKLLARVEELKEKFQKGEMTQNELLDELCELYHVEDYGSKINYSLAFKKYQPQKKAAIVSDIFSTAMYIMEEEGLDAEKIEEVRQSVSAKSYIEDEQWDILENAFRGVVAGANTAVAGKYYMGQTGGSEGGSGSKFKYQHNPSENPKVLRDAMENTDAIYGYSPNPNSDSIGGYADKIDWTNPSEVANANARREVYHLKNDNILEVVNKMKAEGYSMEEIANAANQQRNINRLNDYINDPEGLLTVKQRNLIKYGNENGPTADYLYNKYGSWEKVIEKSMSANPGMDACCGLYDKYYHLYNLD